MEKNSILLPPTPHQITSEQIAEFEAEFRTVPRQQPMQPGPFMHLVVEAATTNEGVTV